LNKNDVDRKTNGLSSGQHSPGNANGTNDGPTTPTAATEEKSRSDFAQNKNPKVNKTYKKQSNNSSAVEIKVEPTPEKHRKKERKHQLEHQLQLLEISLKQINSTDDVSTPQNLENSPTAQAVTPLPAPTPIPTPTLPSTSVQPPPAARLPLTIPENDEDSGTEGLGDDDLYIDNRVKGKSIKPQQKKNRKPSLRHNTKPSKLFDAYESPFSPATGVTNTRSARAAALEKKSSGRKSSSKNITPGRAQRPTKPRSLVIDDNSRNDARVPLSEPLLFCQNILKALMTHKLSWPFLNPVDPIKLSIPDYFDIIKQPMDLGTIKKQLENGNIDSPAVFAQQVRLVWRNALTYNHPNSDIGIMARTLAEFFEDKFGKLPQASTEEKLDRQLQEMASTVESLKKQISDMKNQSKPKPKKQKQNSLPTTPVSAIGSPGSVFDFNEDIEDNRPMTFEEKKNLSMRINKLPPEKLGKVVEIINESIEVKADPEAEIEIDIDILDPVALRKLERYVNSVLANKKRKKPVGRGGNKSLQADITGVETSKKIEAVEKQLKVLGEQLGTIPKKTPSEQKEKPAPKRSANVKKHEVKRQSTASKSGSAPATGQTKVKNEKKESSSESSSASSSGDDSSSSGSDSGSGSEMDSESDAEHKTKKQNTKNNNQTEQPTHEHNHTITENTSTLPAQTTADNFTKTVSPARQEVDELGNLAMELQPQQPEPLTSSQQVAPQIKKEVIIQNEDTWAGSLLNDNIIKDNNATNQPTQALWSEFKELTQKQEQKQKEREEMEEKLRLERVKKEEEARIENERIFREQQEIEAKKKQEADRITAEEKRKREEQRLKAKLEREKVAQTKTFDMEAQRDLMASFEKTLETPALQLQYKPMEEDREEGEV